jgi:hypothetical protein
MWESILWFLIFGGLFYFIMRMAGCGMHSHGGHGDHGNENKNHVEESEKK